MAPADVIEALSEDGTAAVLFYARAVLERERRQTPSLKDVDQRVFVGRVDLAASEAKEGVSRDRVLVASLYRLLSDRGETEGLALSEFKARLVRAERDGLVRLVQCRCADTLNPIMVSASALHVGPSTRHFLSRMHPDSLGDMLHDVVSALSSDAKANVINFARKAQGDEQRRQGRPRLFTLLDKAFRARVQDAVNEGPEDKLVAELYWYFDDHGEATGVELPVFKARLLSAYREGAIGLTPWDGTTNAADMVVRNSIIRDEGMAFTRVRRTNTPPPVPWGPPARPIPPRRTP